MDGLETFNGKTLGMNYGDTPDFGKKIQEKGVDSLFGVFVLGTKNGSNINDILKTTTGNR